MYAILDENDYVIGYEEEQSESSVLLTEEQYNQQISRPGLWKYESDYDSFTFIEMTAAKKSMYAILDENNIVERYDIEVGENRIELTDEQYLEQISTPGNWTYNNGAFTRSELIPTPLSEEDILLNKKMERLLKERESIRKLAEIQTMAVIDTLEDTDIAAIMYVFPEWDDFIGQTISPAKYPYVVFEDELYTVLSEHVAQSDWTPAAAVSLFAKKLTAVDGTPKEWVQPNSTNPYMLGDKVIWTDGKIYESTIDNNIWSPATLPSAWYTPPVLEEWYQKTYQLGDKVLFGGKTWESVIANNSWSPSAYPAGWKEIS